MPVGTFIGDVLASSPTADATCIPALYDQVILFVNEYGIVLYQGSFGCDLDPRTIRHLLSGVVRSPVWPARDVSLPRDHDDFLLIFQNFVRKRGVCFPDVHLVCVSHAFLPPA